jgi:3-oxoacyl-[acyl-carrier-protein] synthase III
VRLVVLAARFGARVDIRDLADAKVQANLDSLAQQGISGVRVSEESTAQLALGVTPGAPDGPASNVAFQAVVVCTDSIEDTTPTEWLVDFQDAAGLGATRAVFVSGSACGNFATGLDVSRGLIASGNADSVLLVLADKVLSGTRHPTLSMTVFSDAAVSCLVTAAPERPSFQLVATATETLPKPRHEPSELVHARTILTATRSAANRATSGRTSSIRHVVTPNFGTSTRELLAMAISIPSAHLYPGLVSENGHCFGADVPLNLSELTRSGLLADGHEVLAIASSSTTLSVMVFRYRA